MANDLNAALPSSLTLTFPGGTATVTLAALQAAALVPELAGVGGDGTTERLAWPAPSPSGTPQLTALAQRRAADWYLYQLGRAHVALDGVQPWQPDGLSEVEWEQSADRVTTRARRGPWDGAAVDGAPTGIVLKDAAGATVDPAMTTLRLDSRSVVTAAGGAGSDTLSVADASVTQQGVVNLLRQAFFGAKTFAGPAGDGGGYNVILGSDSVSISGLPHPVGMANIAIPTGLSGAAGPFDSINRFWSVFLTTATSFINEEPPGVEFSYLTASDRTRVAAVAATTTTGAACFSVRDRTGAYNDGGSATTGGLTFLGGLYVGGTSTGGTGTVTSVATTGSVTGGTITTTGTLSLVNDAASPGNSFYYGTDTGGAKGFFALGAVAGVQGPFKQWFKFTKTFADFGTAGTSNTITLASVPAKTVVTAVVLKASTSFQGGAISTYTISVGSNATGTGTTSSLLGATGVKGAAGDGSLQGGAVENGAFSLQNYSATTNITATAFSTGANLNAATQGSCDIYLLLSTLP